MVNGVYVLAAYPDCTTPYTGEASDDWVYCIGQGTEHERLFRRGQKAEMVTYYNSFKPKLALFHDFAGRFCQQAIHDLLSS